MICNKLSSIEIKGNCFENTTDIKLFDEVDERIRIIYGKNGCGKSSICKAILNKDGEYESAILKDFDENIIEIQDEDKIYIYNETFIDENIKLNSKGLKSIIMFGEQKEIDDKIEKSKEEHLKIKKEIELKEKEIEPYNDNKNVQSPNYHIEKITNKLKEDEGWASRDRNIRGNKQKSAVRVELIKSFNDSKDETKSKEEIIKEFDELWDIYTKVDSVNLKIEEELPKVEFTETFENDIKQLLYKKIEKPELTDREKYILSSIENGNQTFYENVKKQFEKEGQQICPYCFQEVEELRKQEIVNNINNVLNKNVEEHKGELSLIEFPQLPILNEKFKELDNKLYIELEKVILQAQEQLNTIQEKIKVKISNIYVPITEFDINVNDKFNMINSLIDKIELKRKEYNKGIDNKNDNKKKLLELNNKIAWYEIRDDYNSYIIQKQKQEQLEKGLKSKQERLEESKKQISELENSKSNVSIAVDKINESLGYILYSKERLKIECLGNEYCVKVNGRDVKLEHLSIGERNIISLCYFFTTILNNTDKREEFCNPCLIILDDPISSFDFENKIGIYTFFRYIFSKILRNNEESKILCFTHSIESIFNLEKVCSDVQGQGKIKYSIKELKRNFINEFKFKKRNEYMTMLEDIFSFANQEERYEELEHTIGNTMRRALEAYSAFNYRKSIEEITNDTNILNKIEDENQREHFMNSMYRLVLNEESHSYDRARGAPEIDFFEYISIEEKIETAKDILKFIYLLDNIHIKIYLPEKVSIIEEWLK